MTVRFKHTDRAILSAALAAALLPAEPILPSAWAAQNLIVPDGPYAGEKFNPALTPYLIEPLDFFSSEVPGNKDATRKSKQTGFTTLAIAAVGYTVDIEPCDVFLIEPTDSNLTDFNGEKLARAIDGSKALREKIRPQTSRSGKGSTTYSKRYPGGSVLMAIATSTADLRGKTRKKVIKDEASEYPDDLDGQGSPHDMISGAYESFLAIGDWKEINISTPVIKGACYIDAQFEAGDQRYWHVDCPGCGDPFFFKFKPQKTFKFSEAFPYRAYYVTECCGTVIESHQKDLLVRKGSKSAPTSPGIEYFRSIGLDIGNGWIATAPGPGKHRSRHFDALSSPFVPWDTIAERYLAAKDDPSKLKTFDNLTLGLAHEVKGDAPDYIRLLALREEYPRLRIPAQGLLLVASADVQANAIYVEVVAFGSDRQSWVVDAAVLDGDTSDANSGAFAKLSAFYERKYSDEFNNQRRVDAFGVDSGFRANVVYAWTRARENTFALKGGNGWPRPPISTPSLVDVDLGGKKIKQGAAVFFVGGWSLKAQLYADLRKLRPSEGADFEPAGACHFGKWIEENYFVQLTNEYLSDERYRGRSRRVWKERGANHFLDCRIYNLALADYLGLSRMTSDEWKKLASLRGVPAELASPGLFAPDSVKLAAAKTGEAIAEQPAATNVRKSTVSSFMN